MKSFGIGFVVGATLSPTVMATFSTVEQKIKATSHTLKQANQQASVVGEALSARTSMLALSAQYKAGGKADANLAVQLESAKVAYSKAQFAAQKYGVAVRDYSKAYQEASRAATHHASRLKNLNTLQAQSGKRKQLTTQMRDTVVPVLAVAAPMHMAIEFESAMADAAKTIDGTRDASGKLTAKYYEMETAVKSMGRTLPLTHAELAKLFAAAGQQGLSSTAELEEFTIMAAHMSVAFGMSTDAAADSIGGFRTALNLSFPETRTMLDLMNQFANAGSATEAGIADVVRRIGPLGDIAGITYKPMTALAATLTSMKVAPEMAATGIKNLILTMTAGTAATNAQKKAFASLGIDTVKLAEQMQTDGPAAIISVLEAIKKLPQAQQLSIMQEIFGKESLGSIAPLLKNLDLVKENLTLVTNESQYAGAMQQEFENRSKTTANALILMKNRVSELAITVGSVLLPPLVTLLDFLGPIVTSVTQFADANKGLMQIVAGVAAGFVALKVLSTGAAWGFSGLTSLWSGAQLLGGALTFTIGGMNKEVSKQRLLIMRTSASTALLAAKQWLLNAAFLANPIGLVVAGVAAFAAGMVYLYNTCEPVRTAIDAVWGVLKVVGQNVLSVIFLPFAIAWNGIKSFWGTAQPFFASVWEGIKGVWNSVTGFFTDLWAGVKTIAESIWGGIGTSVGAVWETIKAPAVAVFDWIGSKFEWIAGKFQWLAEGWGTVKSWFDFGDDEISPMKAMAPYESTAKAPAAALAVNAPQTMARQNSASSMPNFNSAHLAGAARQPGSVLGGSATGGSASGVSANFSFSVNGVPDADFARRVIDALKSRKQEFEHLLGSVVNDQRRLAYGS